MEKVSIKAYFVEKLGNVNWGFWRRMFYIFALPTVLFSLWYSSELHLYGFPNFQFKSGTYEPEELNSLLDTLPDLNDALKEETVPLNLPIQENPLENLSSALNKTILDKLGHFANIPLHKACLTNKNKISSEKQNLDSKEYGAIGITSASTDSLKFYAQIGDSDCKAIFKESFFEEKFFPPEYSYPITREISPDNMEKVFQGESYDVYLREVTINAEKSYLVVRLNSCVALIAYILLLLTWSIAYFQIRKIIYHLRGCPDKFQS